MTKFPKFTGLVGYSDSFSMSGWVLESAVFGLRLESSTRARKRCTSPSRRALRYVTSEGETVMFGGEAVESSMAEER